jgi:hypothetical protein
MIIVFYVARNCGIMNPIHALSLRRLMRLSENAHLLRYPHPSSLRRTSLYASFLGISEALHLDIFHQPLRSLFFDSLYTENGV